VSRSDVLGFASHNIIVKVSPTVADVAAIPWSLPRLVFLLTVTFGLALGAGQAASVVVRSPS